jgi:chemotaxis protein methyltransferase CheR
MAIVSTQPPQKGQLEAQLTMEIYAFLQQYIRRESGIALDEDKLYLLQSRLMPLVESEHLGTLEALCARLKSGTSDGLRRRVVEAMTTHETLFFRDPTVFDGLRTVLLPAIARRAETTKTLRIWSAACSSGQEPYSLAMLLVELGFSTWDIQILATDLSSQILERATLGRFLQIEVNRGLPAQLLVKYFERAGLEWRIKDQIRRMVRFTILDLRNSLRSFGPFDLVLCRNVLIYFDLETRKKILDNIYGTLAPGGYLVLGTSETTFNLDSKFVRQTVGSMIAYQVPMGENK